MARKKKDSETTPQQDLISQYELPSSDIDPEIHSVGIVAGEESKKPEPKPEAKPEPQKPKHNPRILRMAQSLGISDEEIADLSTDQLLEVVKLETRNVEAQQQRQYYQQQPPQQQQQSPPPPNFDVGLSEEEFDPTLVKSIKNVANTFEDRIRQLESRLSSIAERDQVRENQAAMDRLDRMFSTREDVYGKGPTYTLQQGSMELAKRHAVISYMRHLLDTKQATSMEADFRKADSMFSSPPPQEPDDELNGRITKDQWDKAGLAHPTTRNGSPEPYGPRRAARAVAKLMRDRLVGDGSEQSDLPP